MTKPKFKIGDKVIDVFGEPVEILIVLKDLDTGEIFYIFENEAGHLWGAEEEFEAVEEVKDV